MDIRNKLIWLLSLLFLVSMITGCSSSNSDSDNPVAGNISVTGMVRTPDQVILQGVEIYNDDGVLATSDSSGMVSFSIAANKADSVRLRKPGYAAQTVMLETDNEQADFLATLGKRSAAITLSADAAIDITGISGARVSLPAGALVDANGNPVTGNVELSITPVDVSDDNKLGVFPGAFSGTDINGNPAPIIMSYGTVEYYFSQNGNELNLAGGQSATIEIPVFITNHPDGIPVQIGDDGALWYLDEATGEWLQEDVGTIIESLDSPTSMALQATVTHFSWWNHDIAPEICFLSVTPSGLPSDADTPSLLGSTTSNFPRTSSTNLLSSGRTLAMPRGVDIELKSTAFAPDGLYRANTTHNCGGEAGALTLEFTGPETPVIYSFNGRVKPFFRLELDPQNPSNTRWVFDRNDAIFTWSTVGTELLVLTSDQGHNTTLGNATGSTQFPMELNAVPADQYTFMLTATDSDDYSVTKTVNLPYDAEPTPILHEFNYFVSTDSTTQTATISWDVEGADSVIISYSLPMGGGKTQLAASSDIAGSGATALDLTQEIFNIVGEGFYSITVEFTNQYGTTTRHLEVWVSSPSSGGGDNGGGDDCGELCA